jgi:protein gp37
MAAEWVTHIRDQCTKAGVAFHFKQWGGVFKKRNGRLLEGRTWDEMPAIPTELLASGSAPGRAQLLLE